MAVTVTLEELLEAGAHFGHQARRWNPRMGEYLYGVKDGVHIFDLAKTRDALVAALEVLTQASRDGKKILIVGTKKQVKHRVADVSHNTGSLFVNERWLGGTLTNFTQILATIRKMVDLRDKMAKGFFNTYTKKERLLLERKISIMEKFFGGIETINTKPDLMVIIDTHKEQGAVSEARALGIPTIGVVDSNADPNDVTYPVPMNDDASKSLEFVMNLFEQAILEGKNANLPKAKKEKTKKVKVDEKAKDKDSEEEQLEVAHTK